jgi:hypothetical protein
MLFFVFFVLFVVQDAFGFLPVVDLDQVCLQNFALLIKHWK